MAAGVVLLSGCGSGTTTTSSAQDPDIARCSDMVAAYKVINTKDFGPVSNGATPNMTLLSGDVGAYAATIKDAAPQFADVGVRAAWTLAATNGEAAAQGLLSASESAGLFSLATFIKSATAGIQQCTALLQRSTATN